MVTLTENAVTELRRFMEERQMSPDSHVFRVGVAAGGCSGFQYRIGFDEAIDEAKDHVSEQHGIRMAVDKKSYLYLDGTVIDYYDGIEKRGFAFENPNVVKSCGCGSSFNA
jgi:iron-sulfur cluster assembly protein